MDSGPQSLEGYFRDSVFDQNIVGDLVIGNLNGKWNLTATREAGLTNVWEQDVGFFLSRIREIITAKIYFLVANADFSLSPSKLKDDLVNVYLVKTVQLSTD